MKRYISTSFWDDEWVQSLSFTEKGLFLYLLTNPLTNIAGVYKLPARRIVFDTGLSDSDVEEIMRKFKDAGKAYRHGGYVVLPSWPKHQRFQNQNIDKGISRVLGGLPQEMIAFLKDVGYCYPLDGFSTAGTPAPAPEEDAVPPAGQTEEKKLFLHLWQTTKDNEGRCIFQITAGIDRPKDWERYWQECPPSREEIERAFKNFADGINSGALPRQYIPHSPDRFVLNGGIARFQTPVSTTNAQKKAPVLPPGKIRL